MQVVLGYLVAIIVGYLIVAVLATKQFNHPLWPFKAHASAPSKSGTGGSPAKPSDGGKPDQP